jgi:hypothetical protein
VVYVSVASRLGKKSGKKNIVVKRHRLDVSDVDGALQQSRVQRQRSAACAVLELVCSFLETR